jgi:uncharacterized protein with NRDE domain
MCVAAMAWMARPRWRLVAIGNRDELHARPTAPLAQWDNGVLAGRDLQASGTWLGVHPSGRFALVTNRRVEGSSPPNKASRGALVTDWLVNAPLPAPTTLNPFNLFVVADGQARLMTNHPAAQTSALAAGIHGLSNGSLADRWFKTAQLQTALAAWLDRTDSPAALLAALADERPDPVDPANLFSAPFIRHDRYGTRCSTVMAIDRDGAGVIIERRFDQAGATTGETALEFRWPAQL